MYKIKLFFLFLLITISSCKISEEDNKLVTEKEILKKLEDEGKISRYDELDRTGTIAGIDLNNNGIRDDVEHWIEKISIANS